ncbi:putative ribonuclease H-like domain-containing protein [Tanacetum coccineum]
MPPTPDLSFTGLDEFVSKPLLENRKSDEEVSKVVRKSNDSPIIEDWVSDSEKENVSQTKTEKKTVKPSIAKIEHMKGNMSYPTDYEEINGGYAAFGGNPKGGKITGKCTIKTGNVEEPLSKRVLMDDGSKLQVMMKRLMTIQGKDWECNDQEKEDNVNSTNTVNVAGTNEVYDDVGAEVDINNLDTTIQVSPIPTTRIHKDHTLDQEEPKKVIHALKDPRWIEAMQEELLQFKLQEVERGIVIRNKARLVAQGYIQEEGIECDEVFAPVTRIEAIRLFLAYASFKDFVVYQMDVKSAFFYVKIEEEVYVCQPPGFEDPDFPDRVYKVEKALYGLHQAPRAWYETLSTYLLDNGFQRGKIDKTLFIKGIKMSSMGELTFFLGLQVKQKKDGIFISQDKYVAEILKKFRFTEVKTASTPMETQKPLLKDEDGEEVDVHMYRSMIGSLMYLTSSRPDIMFTVCACARYQVNPKVSHLHAMKRIFRYLKGQPKLGLWYPKDSPFDLVAYTDSDYARASLDRKSTTRGCQFLGCRLISWQCKKQTVVANSTTKAEYVAALSCCGQVLWIQNQLLDYGYNFMHTKIFIDNNKSDGFEQIVDFPNAQPIRYALTVNPTIYISCIEQFWSTGVVKTINREVQLHVLVDGKKIIISKASVKRDLKLEDEEGIDYLPNSTIFEQLALMRYEKNSQKLTFYKPFFSPQWKFLIHTILQCLSPKTTAWNEFSSTMVSAIICLATNKKFNFSKFIFEGMIKNLDNVSRKFLMYPRFVQVFLNQQLDRLRTHKRIYNAPSHTKKIFGNIRRVGKGFSGRVTPLFPTMVVQHQSQMGEGSANLTDPHHTPTIIQPSTQPQKTQKPRKPKRKDTQVPQPSDPSDNVTDEAIHKELGDSLVRAATTASSLEAEQDSGNITKTRSKATPNESSSLGTTSGGGPRCQETMGDTIAQTRFENVSKLSNDSLLARGNTLRSDEDRLKLNELMELCTTLQKKVLDLEKTKTTQANEIASLKRRVKKLEKKRSSRTHKLKRLYKVGLSARVESSGDEESLDDADKEMYDVGTVTGDEVFAEQEVSAKDVNLTVDEVTLAQALTALKSVKPKVKGDVIEEPNVPVNVASASIKAKIEVDHELAQRLQAEEQEEFSKRAGEELEQESTKKQKVDENKYTAELQSLMEVILDEEEVAIDAIPLSTKPPTIIDWKIHKKGKNNYLQIIRADGSSKMYLVFSQLLKSVDKEDLVELYKLVKVKYGSTRPVEDMDLLLWVDLKTMFEPHVEDEI